MAASIKNIFFIEKLQIFCLSVTVKSLPGRNIRALLRADCEFDQNINDRRQNPQGRVTFRYPELHFLAGIILSIENVRKCVLNN